MDMDLLDDLDDLQDGEEELVPAPLADGEKVQTGEQLLQQDIAYPSVKMKSDALSAALAKINRLLSRPPVALLSGSFEDDEEYSMILEANQMSIHLDGTPTGLLTFPTSRYLDDILALFKYIRTRYSKRFPELEQSLPNPIEYARTVRVMGNHTGTASLPRQQQKQISNS